MHWNSATSPPIPEDSGHSSTAIWQYRAGRSCVRTGCISCHQAGIKCKHTVVFEDWRINSDVAWQWQGTWRERRGLHVFVGFLTAPGVMGFFENPFWHRAVMLACENSPAIFHIASAIGSLYEHVLKESAGLGYTDRGGLAFALEQCNRAIGLLTGEEGNSAEVSLTACVLFTCFQALQGETLQASVHSLQGRKLLKHLEKLESNGQTMGLIQSQDVVPVIGTLEMQAKTLQGKAMSRSLTSPDPPFPDASFLYSLDHANCTFHYVYSRLLVYVQDWYLSGNLHVMTVLMAEKRATFATWMRQWGASFADLLFRLGQEDSLPPNDLNRAKILEANHLTASMMSNADQTGNRSVWDEYEDSFARVVDVSASVLATFRLDRHVSLGQVQFPYLTYGLWVDQPLFITMSRCTNPEIRRKAAGLLLGERERKSAKRRGGVEEVCEWTMEQWIDYVVRTRIDVAMAAFFGRFPVESVSIPGYDANCA